MDLKTLIHPAQTTVELIPSYKFKCRPIEHDGYKKSPQRIWSTLCAEQGGFNPYTRQFTPLKYASEGLQVYEALDAITAAVEAGVVDKNDWSHQLFATEDEFEAFLEELEQYDDCYRIADRWWTALAEIADRSDEEGFISCRDIVEVLRESVAEGEKRKSVLRVEAEFKSRPESKPAKFNKKQKELLAEAARETHRQAWKVGAKKDITCEFRLENPFFELRRKTLYAREATLDDLQPQAAGKKSNSSKRSTRTPQSAKASR